MKFTKGIFATFLVFAFVFAAASTASAYTHMGTLKLGSTGSQVMELQKALNANSFVVSTTGAGSVGMESSYFGVKTQVAVKSFQASKGLTSDGIVGPATGAALSALTGTTPGQPLCPNGNTVASSCMTAPAGTPTGPTCPNGNLISNNCAPSGTTPSGPLAGTDGSIADVNELSQYSAEEVGEGEDEVKVAGFEVEATNDGDISIKSAKISFTITNASGSDNLDDYVDSIDVWMGSTKVGSADADDFNEDSSGVYTKTVTLSGSTVRADDTEKFYITVNGVGSFDSGDIDSEVIAIDVENLRFIDGSGVTTTETGYDLDGMDVSIAFVSFSAAADTELKVSKASGSPDAGTVIVDSDENTDDVSLLKGEIEIEGTSDVTIDELPVTLTTVGSADVDLVTGSVTLIIDGETYTESVSTSTVTTATVIFDNLDLTIAAGETVDFEITADINDIDAGNFDEGDTLVAEVTATNSDYIDAENEEGDQLTDDTEKTGTASGDAQEFRTEGISVTLVSTDAEVDADGTNTYNDTGTFTIKYKVTAVGETVYISEGPSPTVSTSITDTTLSGAATSTLYRLDIGGTATVSAVSDLVTYTTSDGAEDASNGVQLEDGESATFTLTVSRTNTSVYASGGLMRVFLQAVGWNTDDGTTFNVYDFDLEDYKTDPIAVN